MKKFNSIYESISTPNGIDSNQPVYAVIQAPGYDNCYVGKDNEGHACLLVKISEPMIDRPSPMRLKYLDVQFDLHCNLTHEKQLGTECSFTVIKCRDLDPEVACYFLSICETIVKLVGDVPSQKQIALVVKRLSSILEKSQNPPSRSLNGLFGELFLIWHSSNTVRTLHAWRTHNAEGFDFSEGDIRIDVKTTNRKTRIHTFSYAQCNPPTNTKAIVASLFTERISGGLELRSLIHEIEDKVIEHTDLVIKLHNNVAGVLGDKVSESMSCSFDMRLAESSLKYFDLTKIPAIRGPLSPGVSEVHFQSDLSNSPEKPISELINEEPAFENLLPSNSA